MTAQRYNRMSAVKRIALAEEWARAATAGDSGWRRPPARGSMADMLEQGIIAADWGTTNLRAFRVDRDGRVVDRRMAELGILNVADGQFDKAFDDTLGDWLAAAPGVPVLLSGMIGSRQGWREAPYVDCPAGADEIARRAVALDHRPVWLVPGLAARDATGTPDVIRGEETQILGAVEPGDRGRRLYCLPGTHAKWARVEGGRVLGFRTAMTGEVFALMTRHGILGRLMRGEGFDQAGFERGLARAEEPGGLLHHLFGARTLGLFEELPAAALASYLSGVLIGHDVRHGLIDVDDRASVALVGDPALAERYALALDRHDRTVAVIDGAAAAARGLWRLARRLFGT
jgi:2-dehydro-3-deoxygalactonokinase